MTHRPPRQRGTTLVETLLLVTTLFMMMSIVVVTLQSLAVATRAGRRHDT
jgi:hypothetical protein